jgi:hypothetical protein
LVTAQVATPKALSPAFRGRGLLCSASWVVIFFEKKTQKTFMFLSTRWADFRDSEQKFFASFFQKRSSSLSS